MITYYVGNHSDVGNQVVGEQWRMPAFQWLAIKSVGIRDGNKQ